MSEGHGFEGTREEMEKAIRRLNVLEFVILAAAFLLALGGGWVAAFLLSTGTSLPFRLTWAVFSLLLLIVPGVLVFGREHLRRRPGTESGDEPHTDNG